MNSTHCKTEDEKMIVPHSCNFPRFELKSYDFGFNIFFLTY